MNYELAKELKEAGYPQFDVGPGGRLMAVNQDNTNYAFPPTLEELIEACGKELASIEHWGSFKRYTPETDPWVAFRAAIQESYGGPTPTEAVARLWLALNKQNV